MLDTLQRILSDDARIAYALVFGSTARGTAGGRSDHDIAVGLAKRPLLLRTVSFAMASRSRYEIRTR
jgi:predicted nucleotidyltransferase